MTVYDAWRFGGQSVSCGTAAGREHIIAPAPRAIPTATCGSVPQHRSCQLPILGNAYLHHDPGIRSARNCCCSTSPGYSYNHRGSQCDGHHGTASSPGGTQQPVYDPPMLLGYPYLSGGYLPYMGIYKPDTRIGPYPYPYPPYVPPPPPVSSASVAPPLPPTVITTTPVMTSKSNTLAVTISALRAMYPTPKI